MILQVGELSESFATDLAREGLFPSVNELMTLKLGRSRKFLSAVRTFVPAIVYPVGPRLGCHLKMKGQGQMEFVWFNALATAAAAAAAVARHLKSYQ